MKKILAIVWLVILVILVAIGLYVIEKYLIRRFQPSMLPNVQTEEKYMVTKVIDGDTIEVNNKYTVRLIGIDTPELNKGKTSECFASESKEIMEKWLLNQEVTLEKDVSDVDKYNRLLRYVYLNKEMINEKLLAQGYAKLATYPPDVKYVEIFKRLNKSAKDLDLGLWRNCDD